MQIIHQYVFCSAILYRYMNLEKSIYLYTSMHVFIDFHHIENFANYDNLQVIESSITIILFVCV